MNELEKLAEAVLALHQPVIEDGEPAGCQMCDWDVPGGGEWPCSTVAVVSAGYGSDHV